MPKTATSANDYLKLWYNGVAVAGANVAARPASSPVTNFYVALHTAWPGRTGNQSTGEAAYTGYARVAVSVVGSGGWTVTNNSVSPANPIAFPSPTGGSETEYFFSIGYAATGATEMERFGVIGSSMGGFAGLSATNVLTVPAVSGVVVGSPVVFIASPGSTLPSGITEGTVYFCKTISGDQVTVSATNGGATLALTTDGAGTMHLCTPIAVTAGGAAPTLGTSSTITEN